MHPFSEPHTVNPFVDAHANPCSALCCLTVEFATLTLDANKQPKAKIYKPAEIDALLQKHGLGKKDEDADMAA